MKEKKSDKVCGADESSKTTNTKKRIGHGQNGADQRGDIRMRTIAMHPVLHLFLTSALCALRIWRCDSIYVETLDGVDFIF